MSKYQPKPPPKRVHHIVPQGWQRRFFRRKPDGTLGETGFYRNLKTGRPRRNEGPGAKMSLEWANLVFDEFFQPSNVLEDHLGAMETRLLPLIDRVCAAGAAAGPELEEVGRFLALQACRYPELYAERLDLAKLYALSLGEVGQHPDAASLNAMLASRGFPWNVAVTVPEFAALKAQPKPLLDAELDGLLKAYGYEPDFNPALVISGVDALPARMLREFDWEMIEDPAGQFILSDHPVPARFGNGFSVALTSRFAIRLALRTVPLVGPVQSVQSRPAAGGEVAAINGEVRARGVEWACGSDAGCPCL